MSSLSKSAALGIEVVAQRSGLSQHLIRMWERRYGAVTPFRTESNRRLYSEADVHRLGLLNLAVQAGHRIGDVAAVSTGKLEQLVEKLSVGRPESSPIPTPAYSADVEKAVEAIVRYDADTLETLLSRAEVDLGSARMLESFVLPLLETLGQQWKDGEIRVAHEHMATAAIRNHLGAMLSTMRYPEQAPVLVTATPAGQLHEIGALVAAVAAALEGWRPVFLGPNLPADEIAGAAQKSGARAIALSLVFPSDDPRLAGELIRLRQLLGEGYPLIVGGRAAQSYSKTLGLIGAIPTVNISDFRQQLDGLRTVIQK